MIDFPVCTYLKSHPFFFQAVLVEETREKRESAIELVRCKLTLFYDYWQMNEVYTTKVFQLCLRLCLSKLEKVHFSIFSSDCYYYYYYLDPILAFVYHNKKVFHLSNRDFLVSSIHSSYY